VANWYYTIDGQQHGPVSPDELRQLAASGRLKPTDMLWREGYPQWVPAGRTKLFVKPDAPAARPPAPTMSHAPAFQASAAHAPISHAPVMAQAIPAPPMVAAPVAHSMPHGVAAAPAMPAEAECYYTLNGQRHGPVPSSVLGQLAASGTLRPTDMVWRAGLANWIPAAQTGMFGPSYSSPPPMAHPAPYMQTPLQVAPLSYATPGMLQYDSIGSTVMYWIGALLLLGFIFPMVGPDGEVAFLNIMALTAPEVPLEIRLVCLTPLLGGIAVLIVAHMRALARPIVMLSCAVLPALILVASRDAREALSGETVPMGNLLFGFSVIGILFGGLSLIGMVVGSWFVMRRPRHALGAIMAAIGAGLFLASLFIPIADPSSRGRTSTIGLIAAFQMLTMRLPDGAGLLRVFALVQIGRIAALATAAVLCFILVSNRQVHHAKARTIFLLVVWTMVAVVGILVLMVLILALTESRGEAVLPVFTAVIKLGAWLGALAIIFPVALADLLLQVVPKSQEEALAPAPMPMR